MSEKRFVVENGNNEVSIKDKVEDNYPFALAYEHIDDADNLIQECLYLVGLLNEQSERIKSLEMELDLIANTKLFSRRKLEEENEQMKKQLEQIPKSIREVWLE